jgi:hypothetical protein
VQHGINGAADVNVVRHVLTDELEVLIPGEMRDVLGIAGYQIVHRYNVVTFRQETVTKV